MPFKPAKSSGGGNFSNPEPGLHDAMFFGLIDLGTHERTYMQDVKTVRKMAWLWELPRSVQGAFR